MQSVFTRYILLTLCALIPLQAVSLPPEAASGSGALAPMPAIEDESQSFGGTWLWTEGDDRFTLTLTQKDGKLTGFHSATRESGGKRDTAGTDAIPSITGDVHGPTVVVRFRSGAPGSAGYGHARLTLRDRYLYWQLIDAYGEHYLPDNAVLIRQPKAPASGL